MSVKKKTGRKPVPISEEIVGQMAFDGAKNSEIAAVLGVDDGTIKSRFSPILTQKRSARRAALRKKQTDMALRGNVPLLIWLGKQELEQVDRRDVDAKVHGSVTFIMPRPGQAQAVDEEKKP